MMPMMPMMRRPGGWVAYAAALACAFLSTVVQADVEQADRLIRDVQQRVQDRLTQEGEALQSDLPRLYALVEELIVPHVDVDAMSRLVLGVHWKKAEDAQRARFAEQFSILIVRTYARSLLDHDQYEVSFLPPIAGKRKGLAVVRTEILPQNGSPGVPIFFRMRNREGAWRVIDLIINGISLVTTYRESFGTQVRSRGLEQLIAELQERNARVQAAP